MIGWLKGRVLEKDHEALVLDVSGVGYQVYCSSNSLAVFGIGEIVSVYTITHAREDVLQLFGFATRVEKQMFLELTKVSGVGPKMALKILSGGSVEHITKLIDSADVAGLSQLPKVGKKTAEQLIVSLRGKLALDERAPSPAPKRNENLFRRFVGPKAEIFSALVHLGFSTQGVETWLTGLPDDIQFEEGVRLGLREMTQV